jgi:hypothetical protein
MSSGNAMGSAKFIKRSLVKTGVGVNAERG